MAVVKNWNLEKNFWEVNKHLGWHEPFKEFKMTDKSAKHHVSSKEMWFIAMVFDYESPKKNYPKEDRITLMEKEYLGHRAGWFENNEKRFKDIIEAYDKEQRTSPYRNIFKLCENLDNVNDNLSVLISAGTTAQMETALKLMKNVTNLYNEFERLKDKLKKDLEERNSNNQDRGEAESSMLEDELEELDGI